MNVSISVFIPAYNSQSLIEDTVIQTYDCLSSNFSDFELVIVDDSSNDQTVLKVQGLMLGRPKLRIVNNINGPSRRENLGKAIYEHATKDIILYFDADLSVPLENIMVFVDEMSSGNSDICIGSRYKGIKANRTLYRMVLSRCFNFFLRQMFNSRINDHICGFKAFRKDVFMVVYKKMGYDETMTRGWFWDAEILINAQKLSMAISEIPVKWNAGEESTFSFWREFKLLRYIAKRYRSLRQ